MNNYLEHVTTEVNAEVQKDVMKHMVNWCHANIRTILRNQAREQMQIMETPTIDTEFEKFEEELHRERMAELGYGDTIPATLNDQANKFGNSESEFLTLTKRAECFASIRRACYQTALAKGFRDWKGDSVVKTFREYLTTQWSLVNQRDIKEVDIMSRKIKFPEFTHEEIVTNLKAINKRRCNQIETEMKNSIELNKGLEDFLDFEEALGKLGICVEQNLRIKVIGGLCYDAKNFALRAMNPDQSQERIEEAESNYNLYRAEALKLDEENAQFETDHEAAINKAMLTGQFKINHLLPDHERMLRLFKEQCKAEQNKSAKFHDTTSYGTAKAA